ncbi:MAG: GNAT family N-acetyltransferase [bacterium]|nr:GNAT family N-acetyltransferase [bacterium]
MNAGVVITKILEGRKKLIIRYPRKGDVGSLLQYINTLSSEQTFVRLQGEKLTIEEETKYLNGLVERIENNKAVQMLAFLDEDLVGVAHIEMGDKVEKHIGTLGISIAKESRGRGIGKMLMETILREAIQHLPQLRIITLEVFANNPLAASMYKKFGFSEYGRLPQGIIHKGKFTDRIHMYKAV